MGLKKYSDIINTELETLERDLKVAKDNLHKLKFEHKVKGLSNPSVIRHLRREIAQMNTELTKRK
ncbi:MAG: 50S ribosomal protein L29 [Saprospiraceae bacterium]|nr:50S ribosomal protein L29 [Candidatus Vicinibacter affinis]MBP6172133.1 50S ribosomal protein L29 [Saprospiraceae bacterium]MBK6822832.1 50S ribosomal protein L29 [Candidatus Vicinibacter affinis]MBK7304929.1 50S ribosomal protein L29 [Candidatus Vicinibacter affinis]MBK7694694.1 50S ribosomal protein L29 [Candidatus Vicinibacter affinis]